MTIHPKATPWSEASADWLVVGVSEGDVPSDSLEQLDTALDGLVTRLREAGDLTGELGKTVSVPDAPAVAAKRLLFVGLGKPDELTLSKLDTALMTASRLISDKENVSVAVALPPESLGDLAHTTVCQAAAVAFTVGAVGQDLYKEKHDRFPFASVDILVENADQAAPAVAQGAVIGEAVNLTRELINRPAQDIYPETVAARAREVADATGMECTILDEEALEQERMGSLLAVARGSDRPPRVVILEYKGGAENDPTLALVGKGVTFDSGGLSLKPNAGMLTMKSDMSGSATVLGAISAIARLGLPVNVTGYLGLVENMINGSSYKLGDVLTARNGKTIEVHNTDAEGRLVLADVLALAVDRGADRIVDLATLTGACVVALGEDVTGVFTNDANWAGQILAAANRAGELVWEMPTFDLFDELLKSDVADIKNVGPRWGGAVTAAKFLANFVDEKPWVHLDIAGPAFAESSKPHRDGGATGCMVRTLIELAEGG